MKLKMEILEFCKSLGLQNVGFIKCRTLDELKEFYADRKKSNLENEFEEEDINKRIDLNYYMEEGKTIISIAFPYSYALDYVDNGFSIYTRGYDYHRVVGSYLEKISEFIISKGGKAKYFTDSNVMPERYIAYLAGVGFIGKNNMLITKEYGSYVFLGEIITDLEIYDKDKGSFEELLKYRECGECNNCYKECPTKAINAGKKNSNICLSYLTQKKELDNWEIRSLKGRVFGCDTCQKACPYNKEIESSSIEEFRVLEFMNVYNEQFIINMNNSEFKNTFKQTSCGWRGKNVLKRNALIRKALFYNEEIENYKNDSEYINKYINRLLNRSNL